MLTSRFNSSLLIASLIAALLAMSQHAAHASAAESSGPAASAATSQAQGSDDSDDDDSAASAAASTAQWSDDSDDDSARSSHHHWHLHRHGHEDSVFNLGANSDLPEGRRADSVVAIFGSASSEGEADTVMSMMGNTRVTGHVESDAVALLGNVYIDSEVDGDVFALLGNVELGPHAEVHGDVSAVGGKITRDPAATVVGKTNSIGGVIGGFKWLKPWIDHCLFYGRPLALVSGIEWAWGLALAFLVFYVGLALLFRGAVSRCVLTVEQYPGMTLVAALLTVLLTPIVFVLLCITVIGLVGVPWLLLGLFCAGLFGKAVMLAWLGHRCTSAGGRVLHPALAVLIGGAIVLVLYLVPVLGFILYKLLGIVGLGAVIYTLLLAARARHAPAAGAAHADVAGAAPGAAPTGGAASPAFASAAAASSEASAAAVPPASAHTLNPALAATLPRAGFWIRMLALLIDVVLIGFLMGILGRDGDLFLLLLAVYGALMWRLRGSTIGGIVLDLQVVRLDGRPVAWETAIVRALGCFLSMAVAGLGFFWIAFDHGKQAWHDKIAGTAVVRVPKGTVSLV
jgi:uncharacterized RDD family membrane protein YckC